MKKVNTELIQLYWEIGGEIFRQQQEKGWGKSVVELLSKELQKEFPGVKGFTTRNLWFMRQFYVEYTTNLILKPSVAELEQEPNSSNLKPSVSDLSTSNLSPSVGEISKQILPPLVAEIGWSHNVVIMQKCKDSQQRLFYIKMTKRFGWTKDVLINNISGSFFGAKRPCRTSRKYFSADSYITISVR